MVFSRYLIAGLLNTSLTYLLYLGLLHLMPYVLAYSATYIAGIALGYGLNSKWVFKTTPSLRSAAAYPLTYGINYCLGVAVLWCLVEWFDVSRKIAPLIVVVVSVPVMYIVTRTIFNHNNSDEKTIN
jgi:putative flippase GtrA